SDPHMHRNGREDDKPLPNDDDFFRFVKIMKKKD
ncbi:MAG: GNAT family N-acetyltransferase, partial [Bacillus sp. (in: Bacteria)]|nr:GNAT family N-acetyltransferase [Bacillus sp. (in: firmicutes)]